MDYFTELGRTTKERPTNEFYVGFESTHGGFLFEASLPDGWSVEQVSSVTHGKFLNGFSKLGENITIFPTSSGVLNFFNHIRVINGQDVYLGVALLKEAEKRRKDAARD